MYTITRIDVCGFPAYACGHNYILLTNKNEKYYHLAHVGVREARDEFPNFKAMSYKWIKYWHDNLCTNKQTRIVRAYKDPKIIKEKLRRSHFKFKAYTWSIEKKNFNRVSELIDKDAELSEALDGGISRFYMSGEKTAKFFKKRDGGANCVDWTNKILKTARINANHPINRSNNLNNLIAYLSL